MREQLAPVFDGSIKGVFVYLDGQHKACSERLAAMFDYSPTQWEELYPFERLFSEKSAVDVMATYYEKIIAEKAPAEVPFTGIRKDGSSFEGRLLMVPLTFDGLLFALCFAEPEQTYEYD